MQQVDDPPSLPVGTEVSAKYKGAFCEAKVSKVVRNIKVKVAYKQGLGSGIVSDELIKAAPGQLRVGAIVEVRHPDRKEPVEATVTKIQDCSQYTVVFDDGDITTLRRTALCLKSGRHFNESETLDQLPLTHPEHFGNPVVGGRRGRRRGHPNEDSSEEEEESESKEVVNEKEENIGKVVCVEIETKKKDKEKFFPGLVVAPTAQATVRIRVKDDYLVRSFKDGRYYTVPKKEATEFTREAAIKQNSAAVQAALEFLDNNVLPAHWDRDTLFGLRNSSSDDEGEIDSDSSDDEPREEKDRFVAQLYKYMDDRGTPLNKVPTIQNRDVDLYRLFRAVQKRGGYNRVTAQNQWKSVATRLGFTPVTTSVSNMVKQSFKKFLQPYGDFNRKLGCSMLMTPRNSSRTKGRSLVRAISVASPKPTAEPNKEAIVTSSKPNEIPAAKTPLPSTPTTAVTISTPSTVSSITSNITTAVAVPTPSVNDESENTSESSQELVKNRRKPAGSSSSSSSGNKVKTLVEKYEEKTASAAIATALLQTNTKDESDLPLSKIKAAAASNALRFLEEKEARERENSSSNKDASISSKDSGRSGSTPATRDPSPAGSVASTTTTRKEKSQRKIIPPVEERRNKRKKEEVPVEKIDAGDFIVELGDKLKVYYHEKKVTYEAKVIEINSQRGIPMYMVHYTGWNNRYDEWVPRERIAENLSKSYKNKKGPHFDHGEKNKENPPKPLSSAALAAVLQNSMSGSALNSTSIMAAVNKAAITSGSKRGRGRSESARTRSVTPSSVASNSGRTKSVSATVNKHRRSVRTGARRVSVTASDISMPTESETDSDEPVKPRSTRASKDTVYKPHPASGKKMNAHSNTKAVSSSAVNSQSETGDDADDDDEDGPANSLCSIASSVTSSTGSTQKGRDYDLNQIRSELKGFKGLKSPSPVVVGEPVNTVSTDLPAISTDKIKDEKMDFDYKSTSTSPTVSTATSTAAQAAILGTKTLSTTTTIIATVSTTTSSITTTTTTTTAASSSSSKELSIKPELKKEKLEVETLAKSTTDTTSETDSCADDDSQSSDRTTQLQNMTKKFQQKINADKQRVLGKNLICGPNKSEQSIINPKTRIVEKILKDSMAEKRQESLKNKPNVLALCKDEHRGVINKKENNEGINKQSLKMVDVEQAIDDIKATSSRFTTLSANTTHTSIITNTPTSTSSSLLSLASTAYTPGNKYSSVIVEKPLNIGKKIDATKSTTILKKTMDKTISDAFHNISTTNLMSKDILKIETPAAASPTSSTSSISSHISSNSSRSIPDMSKLDISSPSSSSSSLKDVKATSNALANLSSLPKKPTSPDIYEFNDTEPFEFEIRKPPLSAASSSSSNIISHSSTNIPSVTYGAPISARRQSYKPGTSAAAAAAAGSGTADSLNLAFMSSLLGRKKRGSPLKDMAANEKLKQSKLEEKSTVITATSSSGNLVADAKLSHHVMPAIIPPTPTKSTISTPSKLSVATSGFSTIPTSVPTTPQAAINVVPVTPTSSMTKSSSIIIMSSSPASTPALTVTTTATPSKANAFDVLLKSPSFNLINALNEELAQTVQETTRALTDVVMPATPSTPPVMEMTATPKTAAVDILSLPIIPIITTAAGSTTICSTPSSSKISSSNTKVTEVSSIRLQSPVKAPSTPKIVSSSSVVSTTATTTAITSSTSTKTTVGSPFMETKKNVSNVFEICPYDMASTSIETRDTKFGLEKANFLLSATVGGGFDFEPSLKTEHKPVSIADKVLKAISQKKEEENKIKEQKPEIGTTGSEANSSTSSAPWPALSAESPVSDQPATTLALSINTNTIANAAGTAELAPLSYVATLSTNTTKALHSPKTTKLSLLEANSAKNTDLNETIQKLECAIQRKTCASLKIAATAALAFSTNVSTVVTSSPATNFSEESIDSADSDLRLVIEDVGDDLPKSPVIMLKQLQQLTESKSKTPLPIGDVAATQMPASSPTISHISSMSCESGVSMAPYEPKLNTPKAPNTVCITVPEIPASVVMATSTVAKLKPTSLIMTTRSEMGITTSTSTTTTNSIPRAYPHVLVASTSGFFLNSRTELRPEDGVKPISDMLLHAVSAQADVERGKEEIEQAAIIAHAASAGGVCATEIQQDSINLLCEETIPGSPAPAVCKDEPPLAVASQHQIQIDGKLESETVPIDENVQDNKNAANGNKQQTQVQQPAQQQQQLPQSSPNESCSQDESGEESKKTQSEQDFGSRKRRRTRKTSERDGQSLQQQQQPQEGPNKRRRTLTNKKHNQGSDSDENSDSVAIRSAISTRQQQMQQFQTLQQPQLQEQGMSSGMRPCPYNFLVQLDPTLSSDQCIAILLKQIQELRKTYNNIKGDLAAIDRRRKKIRRRNREKKQNQNQQPTQLLKVSATL